MKALLIVGMILAALAGILAARLEDWTLYAVAGVLALACYGLLVLRHDFGRDHHFNG